VDADNSQDPTFSLPQMWQEICRRFGFHDCGIAGDLISEKGCALTDCHRHADVAKKEWSFRYCCPDPFGYHHCLVQGSLRKQTTKFLAAVASKDIYLPDDRSGLGCDALQDEVAALMATHIIRNAKKPVMGIHLCL